MENSSMHIDTSFNMYTDANGRDPDLYSPTPDGALAYIRMREIDLLTRDLEAFTFPMRVARLDDLSPEAVIDLLLPEEKR